MSKISHLKILIKYIIFLYVQIQLNSYIKRKPVLLFANIVI